MLDDDLAEELDAWLADDEHSPSNVDQLERAVVAPQDERQVNAMLRKRARLVAEQRRVVDFADEQIAQMVAWRDDRCAGLVRQLAWLERGLEQFARQALPALKRKSLPLPDGTLKLTQPGSSSLVVDDLGAFLKWTDEDRDERERLLRRTVDVDKTAAKQALAQGARLDELCTDELDVFNVVDAAGEVVPGVTMTKPAAARLSIG